MFLAISCSKEENTQSKNLPLTTENITGIWYLKKVIKPDGTLVDYKNVCESKKDFLEITPFTIFRYNKNYANCIDVDISVKDPYITTTNIVGYGPEFDGVVSKLTKIDLEISYEETRYITNFPQNFSECKGIILSKNSN
jgi:hypothetical protein